MSEQKAVRKVIRRSGETLVVSREHAERGIHSQVPVEKGAKIKLIPLSGFCQDGSVAWIIEYEDEIVIIDGGIPQLANHSFDESAQEVDISYLIQNKHKIKAYLISHGHEDQIALIIPILQQLDIPVLYAPPLAARLIEEKIKNFNISKKIPISTIKPRQSLKIGSMAVTYVRNTHSIFDSYSLIIHTPAGKILYTGDFKFDYSPVDKEPFDFYTLLQAGEDGILALISDSKNSNIRSYTPSESSVYIYLEKAFKKAIGKIIISTFSYQVCRIKQIIEIAEKLNKKVAIVDDEIAKLVRICKELGYMNFVDSSIVDYHDIPKVSERRLVILTASTQFDDLSPMTKIARDEHIYVKVKEKDTILISALPSQRNDRTFVDNINSLKLKGADVFYGTEDKIFVSGHGSATDKQIMINMIKPKYFLPSRGEYGDLYRHRGLAIECGIDPKNIYILKNYDVLEFSDSEAKLADSIMSKASKEKNMSEIPPVDLSPVQIQLSNNGFLSIFLAVKNDTLVSPPQISSRGIEYLNDDSIKKLSDLIKQLFTAISDKISKAEKIEAALSSFFTKELKKEPLIKVMILEAN